MARYSPRPEATEIAPAAGPSGVAAVVLAAVVVGALYFGREILVPFALAVLLSFALAPLVTWLRRLRIGRVSAVVAVVALAFAVIFALGAVVAGQLATLAENLPRYQYNIQTKIRSLQHATPDTGLVERASRMLRELGKELEQAEKSAAPAQAETAETEPRPVPVEIKAPEPRPIEVIQNVIGPLLEPLATTGVVIVFVIFILLQREDLRDRLIRLMGTRDLQRTTTALDDAARRVSRYLLMQLIVNATYGIPVGVGLWFIGVPNPVLWGMLATLLRFVPYIGPVVAAIFPLALALAVDPGWTMLLWTAALFILLEVVSNNVVEPWLYGSSTGLSPVAIILAAIFWTWLWGPIGLLLSTPLTVCVGVLGRHLPQLQFLDVLLGNEPVLSPEERFYQRLLAGDPEEAAEQAEEFLREEPLAAFYEEVAIPALRLAEADRLRGAVEEERRARILEGVVAVVEDLEDHVDAPPEPATDAAGEEPPGAPAEEAPAVAAAALPAGWGEGAVLCAAGRSNLDEAAATLLGDLLRRAGFGVRIVPCEDIALSAVSRLDLEGARIVCLSYLSAASLAQPRYLVRRLRRRRPDLHIVIGIWGAEPDDAQRRDTARGIGADAAAFTLPEAVEAIVANAVGAAEPQSEPQAAAQ